MYQHMQNIFAIITVMLFPFTLAAGYFTYAGHLLDINIYHSPPFWSLPNILGRYLFSQFFSVI